MIIKNLKFITILNLLFSQGLIACSTCYGDPNSDAGRGMDMAIITLLSIIGPILLAIAAGIISIGLKSKKYNQNLIKK